MLAGGRSSQLCRRATIRTGRRKFLGRVWHIYHVLTMPPSGAAPPRAGAVQTFSSMGPQELKLPRSGCMDRNHNKEINAP